MNVTEPALSEAPNASAAGAALVEPTPAESARAELLGRSPRGYVQIRGSLVQRPSGADRSSTLARLVTTRHQRALLAYLLLLTCWPWLKEDDQPLEAVVWARLLTTPTGLTWTETTVSRTWSFLEGEGLVSRKRVGNGRLRVSPRREDGRADYATPNGAPQALADAYFTLPLRFWEVDFEFLTMPALAVLLVIAKETNRDEEVRLTHSDFEKRYGIRRTTAKAGIDELKRRGLLNDRAVWVPAPLSKIGTTDQHYYSLTGDYSQGHRATLRSEAKIAGDKRRARSARASVEIPGSSALDQVPRGTP